MDVRGILVEGMGSSDADADEQVRWLASGKTLWGAWEDTSTILSSIEFAIVVMAYTCGDGHASGPCKALKRVELNAFGLHGIRRAGPGRADSGYPLEGYELAVGSGRTN